MTILTDGSIKALIGQVLGSSSLLGEAMTLRTRSTSIDINGVNVAAWTNTPIKATLTAVSRYRRESSRIPDEVEEIIAYQASVSAAIVPQRGGRIICRGVEYEILTVDPDPAAATWTMKVMPA